MIFWMEYQNIWTQDLEDGIVTLEDGIMTLDRFYRTIICMDYI
jgi:hypothetical protein